jgi:hypoxanthine phosphoribosyltransferase
VSEGEGIRGEPPPTVLLDQSAIAAHVQRIARQIVEDHPDGVVLVGVLKGALIFLADLARAVTGIDVVVDFLAISRYAPDSGRVRILKDLDIDVEGRDVVLVEDIVDTGLTLTYILGELQRRGPRSLEACALLDKTARRIVPTPIRFVGFAIEDEFVLGYGLDYAERYRNLDRVVAGDLAALRVEPDAHVEELFSR